VRALGIDRPPLTPSVLDIAGHLARCFVAHELIERDALVRHLVGTVLLGRSTESSNAVTDGALLADAKSTGGHIFAPRSGTHTGVLCVGREPVNGVAVLERQRRPPRRILRH